MPLTVSEALEKAQTVPERFQAFGNAIRLCRTVTEYALRATTYVFLFFLIHQLFFWVSRDPEKAFRFANLLIDFVEIVWDLTGILYNALAEVANAAIFPLWNAFTFYVISPGITLVLEVFSQIFLRKSYNGVLKEDDFPYGGFVCDASVASSAWCGRFAAYDQRLAEGNSKTKTDSVTFGTATARRLSELADGDVDFDVPSFSLGAVVGALDGLTTDAILLGGSAADLLMGVLYEVLSTTAVFLFDAVYTILTTVFDVIKLLVKSGMLQTLLSIGIDFLLILALEIAVPMLVATVDAVVCVLQLFMWGTWKAQLECAELNCFRGPDAAADWLMFTSVPQVIERFGSILEATLNSKTGRMFTGNSGNIDLGVSDLDEVFPTLAGTSCTACFVCRFPELRALWFVSAISISLFNPDNFNRFYGNVTQTCMTNGSYYEDVLCGPRGSEDLPFRVWKVRYPHGYAKFDIDIAQSYAEQMITRGTLMGLVAGGSDGAEAIAAGEAWYERDQTLPPEEQAAAFTHQMCRLWRKSDAGAGLNDAPQRYADFAPGSIAYITSSFMLETCKRFKFEVFGDVSRALHNFGLEVAMCMEDPVKCKKDFEHCIGGCGGESTSTLHYDFNTIVALSELNPDVIGFGGFDAAHANCTIKTDIIEVPLFEGGDAFAVFAERARLNSGMTALDNAWCENNPLSCGAIQQALERSPGLAYVPGIGWRHRYDMVPPSPPPPPFPPPRTLYYGPAPPPPPPPPTTPPPYYEGAEPFFGIDTTRENLNATHTEYRSACLFVKRLTEKRKRASYCFARVIHPSPPPPPPVEGLESAQWYADLLEQRRVNGDGDKIPGDNEAANEAQHYSNEVTDTIYEANMMIETLGETNPVLRGVLGNAIDEMRSSQMRVANGMVPAESYFGRRLMQRQFDYPDSLDNALVDHPIQNKYRYGIPGVTRETCEAICEGVSITTNASDTRECRGYAFKRAFPFSLRDFTGRCYILSSLGACKPEDFAASMYTRQIESEEVCHKLQPGNDNPLCLSLATTREDVRVLTHADAAAIAAQTPRDPAPGSGGLPLPRTALEAGFMIGKAREGRVYAFWAASPDSSQGDVTMHWYALGGVPLVYRKGETRCILVSSRTSTTQTAMYASLEPCDAKLSDGVITVAAAAAPPPPPGATELGFFDPAKNPPPPPSVKQHAYSIFIRETIIPYTEAICSGAAGEGEAHRGVCTQLLDKLSTWQFIQAVGTVAPICNEICWHSCDGNHVGGEDDDSFSNCQQTQCARTSCLTFLLAECPPILHTTIETKYKETCEIVRNSLTRTISLIPHARTPHTAGVLEEDDAFSLGLGLVSVAPLVVFVGVLF